MTEDVMISMRGLQFDQSEIDAENVETIVIGKYTFEEETGYHHMEYDEMLEGFDQPTHNILRFGEHSLELTRSGLVNVHMVFDKNHKNLTNYVTPFGAILIGIDTKNIHITQESKEITVDVEYTLDINYEYLSNCRIAINIKSI